MANELKIKELEESNIAVEALSCTPEKRPMETRVAKLGVDDIPKLYGNERDKVDEWIYLVEAKARFQGISHHNL
ncbi:unnamed protein product [Brachionus calyciflorus]|uniref:Uncharacterized protein n=1 Tax=Brachionus calyciflorus TaxID=104777 RepID=A0A814IYA1_9BILA|nr:unnamed protein product [Brachionus calyciflorus]